MNISQRTNFLLLIFFLTACQPEIIKFNEALPYSIIIEKYRSPENAWDALERTKEMAIPSYLVKVNEAETGVWYMLLTGAFKTLESAIAKRIEFEDGFSFMYLDIVNFNQVSMHQMSYIEQYEPLQLPDSIAAPVYNETMVNLLKAAPYSNTYAVEDVKLVQPSDSIDVLRRTSLKTNVFDMPRGVYPPNLINAADAIAEIVYLDELIGLRYTVDVIALNPAHELGADVSEVYAEKIIGTRKYEFEEMLPRSFNGNLKLNGYAVNIEPQKGKVFRYIILQDITGKYLYLIQSAKSSQENIDSFASSIASDNGLLGYPALHENLAIMKSLPSDYGHLAYVHFRKLNNVPGKTGAFIEKHFKTNFVFFDKIKGEWEFTASRYFDAGTIATVFRNVYTPSRRNTKDSLEVKNNHAWLTTLRRRHPATKKYVDFPNEVQFSTDKYIYVLSNKRYAYLEEEEMMAILNYLDLAPKFVIEKNFFDKLVSD
jgi:hypothetical protein